MIRLINLSDFHYRPNWDEEVGLVLRKFLLDLEETAVTGTRNILVFSGDVVQSGEKAHYYSELADQLSMSLDAIGISRESRIIVPGNHDVSRENIQEKFLTHYGVLSQIREETAFNNALDKELREILAPKFQNYLSFSKAFTTTSDVGSLGGYGVGLDDQVGVYLLNSALCSHGSAKDTRGKKVCDKGLLMINTRAITNGRLRSSKIFGDLRSTKGSPSAISLRVLTTKASVYR